MTKGSYNIKPANVSDINYFYTKAEQKEDCIIAFVLRKGEKQRLAMAGVFVRKEVCIAFVRVKENLPKKLFFKEIKKGLVGMQEMLSKPIYAIRDEKIKGSDIFLKKLGFKFVNLNTNQEEVYIL